MTTAPTTRNPVRKLKVPLRRDRVDRQPEERHRCNAEGLGYKHAAVGHPQNRAKQRRQRKAKETRQRERPNEAPAAVDRLVDSEQQADEYEQRDDAQVRSTHGHRHRSCHRAPQQRHRKQRIRAAQHLVDFDRRCCATGKHSWVSHVNKPSEMVSVGGYIATHAVSFKASKYALPRKSDLQST